MFGALGRRAGGLGFLPGGAGGFVPLVQNGWLHPAITFTRASPAAFLRSTDGALVEVGANATRFDPDFQALLEGAATNLWANPRGEGALPGAPGTMPSGWNWSPSAFSSSGITPSITVGTLAPGVSLVGLSLTTGAGVTSGASSTNISVALAAAAQNQTWSSAWSCRIAGGSTAGFSMLSPRTRSTTSGGTQTGSAQPNFAPLLSGASQRITSTLIIPPDGGNITAFVSGLFQMNWLAGASINVQFELALPQLVLGPLPQSPILPPVGVPGVTTRQLDAPTAPLASLGIPGSGACTLTGVAVVPVIGQIHTVWQMDDGSNNNRVMLRVEANGELRLLRTLAGVPSSVLVGSAVANVPFRWTVAVAGDGGAAASMNGASAASVSGGPTSGLTTLRIGHAVGGDSLQGYARRLAYSRGVAPGADLPALSRRDVWDLTSVRNIIEWP